MHRIAGRWRCASWLVCRTVAAASSTGATMDAIATTGSMEPNEAQQAPVAGPRGGTRGEGRPTDRRRVGPWMKISFYTSLFKAVSSIYLPPHGIIPGRFPTHALSATPTHTAALISWAPPDLNWSAVLVGACQSFTSYLDPSKQSTCKTRLLPQQSHSAQRAAATKSLRAVIKLVTCAQRSEAGS